MNIGIIGSGNIGSALVKRFRAVGHAVSVANSRGPASLAELAKKTGARAVSVREAARENDVVVVTIPQKNVASLPGDLFSGVPGSVVVIDTGNYYPRERDGRIEAIESGKVESAYVADRLGRPVVKAFNNIYAAHLLENGKPAGTPGRIALPIAGDDARAKAVVTELVEAIGFDAVDAGTIDESWRQQPGSPAYTRDFDAVRLRAALGEAFREADAAVDGLGSKSGDFEHPR